MERVYCSSSSSPLLSLYFNGRREDDEDEKLSGAELTFENIADATNRVDELRLERVVHLCTQPAYNHIDDVRVSRESDFPNVFCNFGARYHSAG